ncbi:MAG: hypothetical protein LBM13_00505, partial [Candidatus Ancillula sp.]|nr:hypothetical protein [Candidatus Ancillula sp.]
PEAKVIKSSNSSKTGPKRAISGTGTKNDPVIVTSEAQLEKIADLVNLGSNKLAQWVKSDKSTKITDDSLYFKLGSNITLSGNWIAIGTSSNPFMSNFDGAGYIISGLKINTTNDYQGLFGSLATGSTVQNVVIINSEISGGEFVGGIAGENSGTIQNSVVLAEEIAGTDTSKLGRITGKNSGTLKNNYGLSTTSNKDQLCGKYSPSSWSNNTLTSLDGKDIDYTNLSTIFGNLGFKVPTNLPEYITNLNYSDFFRGTGTVEDPYLIDSAYQLVQLSCIVDNGYIGSQPNDPGLTIDLQDKYNIAGLNYKLNSDLNLAGYGPNGKNWNEEGDAQDSWFANGPLWYSETTKPSVSGWAPIGTWLITGHSSQSSCFMANFDGNGKIISNLSIDREDSTDSNLTESQALFGNTYGAITNIALENVNIVGNSSNIAGIVAVLNHGSVTNSYVTGQLIGKTSNAEGVAGIVSRNLSASNTISNNSSLLTNLYSEGSYYARVYGEGPLDGVSNNYGYTYMTNISSTLSSTCGVQTPNWDYIGTSNADGIDIDSSNWQNLVGGSSFGHPTNMPAFMSNRSTSVFSGGDGVTPETAYLISSAYDLAQLACLVNNNINGYNSQNIYYKLSNNIDLSSYSGTWISPDNAQKSGGWEPIGTGSYPFTSNFDGDGHSISNLTSIKTSPQDVGLFGVITNGNISNLSLVNVNISGGVRAGALAGSFNPNSSKSTIKSISVSGSVAASNSNSIGGIIGYMSTEGSTQGTLNSLVSKVNVSGVGYIGGIVGEAVAQADQGSILVISDTISLGNINALGETTYSGGIAGLLDAVAGQNSGNASLFNSAALNESINAGKSYSGRILGANSQGSLSNNYGFTYMKSGVNICGAQSANWQNNTIDGTDGLNVDIASPSGHSLSSDFFSASVANAGLDLANSNWNFETGELPTLAVLTSSAETLPDYLLKTSVDSLFVGLGTTGDPYQISTENQLADLACIVNHAADISSSLQSEYNANSVNYKLTTNLDLSSYVPGKSWQDPNGDIQTIGWIPIGTRTSQTSDIQDFKANFDGAGHVISNLQENTPNNNNPLTGIFGSTKGNTIQNLGVENVNIIGYSTTAGLISNASETKLEQVYTTGSISSNVTGVVAGGLVANFGDQTADDVDSNSKITNSYSTVNLQGIGGCILGGLVGKNIGVISNSYASGNVLGQTDQGVNNREGGLVGQNLGIILNSVAINQKIAG